MKAHHFILYYDSAKDTLVEKVSNQNKMSLVKSEQNYAYFCFNMQMYFLYFSTKSTYYLLVLFYDTTLFDQFWLDLIISGFPCL